MRLIKVLRAIAFLSEFLNELAILIEFDEAGVGAAMSFAYPDLTVGCDEDIVWLIERIGLREYWVDCRRAYRASATPFRPD